MIFNKIKELWDKVCKKKKQPDVRKSDSKVSGFVKTEYYSCADKQRQKQLEKREKKWKAYKKHNRRK